MLHLVNEGEFPSMALELNGAPHFLAGIATTHITSRSPH